MLQILVLKPFPSCVVIKERSSKKLQFWDNSSMQHMQQIKVNYRYVGSKDKTPEKGEQDQRKRHATNEADTDFRRSSFFQNEEIFVQ